MYLIRQNDVYFGKDHQKCITKTQSYKFCPATISLDKCLSFTPLCSSLRLYEETKQQSKRQKFHTISLEKCLSLTPPVSCATAHPIRHLWPWQTEGRLHRQGYRCKHRRKHILTHNKTDMYVGASTDVNTWRHFQEIHGPKGICVEMQIQTHRETYKDSLDTGWMQKCYANDDM